MTRRLAVAVSRTTLLPLIRALPVPEPGRVAPVGVDDFAFRKGSHGHRPSGRSAARPPRRQLRRLVAVHLALR
jgi:hypothetical protein